MRTLVASSGLALLVCALIAVASCGSQGDSGPIPRGGASGEAGSAGQGGSKGVSGPAGSGGMGGLRGSSGSRGSGGKGGSAGSCFDGGHSSGVTDASLEASTDGSDASGDALEEPMPVPCPRKDHFNLPPGSVLSISLKFGTDLSFTGKVNGVATTVSCTGFSANATIATEALTVDIDGTPTITGCKDSRGAVTFKTNSTEGKWTMVEVDANGDQTEKEPNTGDKMTLVIPKGGASFTSTGRPPCTVDLAPGGSVQITGDYDDKNGDVISSAAIAANGVGCTIPATWTMTGTLVFNRTLTDEP